MTEPFCTDFEHSGSTYSAPRLIIIPTKLEFLYPPHREYISFVNTFVTPRNNDVGSMFLGDI